MRPKPQWGLKGSRHQHADRPASTKFHGQTKQISPSCFNCNKPGHHFRQCKRPRLVCGKCNRLGHNESNCHSLKVVKPTIELIRSTDTQECYFIDCTLNGKSLKADVDTGCNVITIIRTIACKQVASVIHGPP
jgi:hypothetical protein